MTLHNDKQPWYRQRWPWLLMAGPAIVVVAGIFTAWLAVTSNDGLVTDDYYKQGLAVNQVLERDRQADNLGLQAQLMRSGLHLRLMLTSQAAAAFPQEVTVRLVHPTRAGQDQLVRMHEEGAGFYAGDLSAEISGRWLLSIEDSSGQWRLQGEWLANATEPLHLSAKAEK